MNVSLRQLRVFVAVAEALSFTRAGDALDLPQSTVSTQLRELEVALGLRLFDRHTRMLRLTEAGAEILPLARKTLADLDEVVGSSAQLKTLGRGRVSIAASSIQAALVLPRVMRAFMASHPGVRVDLFDVSQDEVLSMVRSGAVDFGLGTAFDTRLEQQLSMRPLWRENYYAVLPPDHALSSKREVTWRELMDEPLIGPRKGNPVRAILDFGLASEGILLNLRHETSLPFTIAGMVEGGLGVGILTGSVRQVAEALNLQLRPIHRPTIQREVALVLHAERSLSPAARQFADALIALPGNGGAGGKAARGRRR